MTDQLITDFEVKSVDEEGSFVGYASVFGLVDQGRDVVEVGAFTKSLLERGAGGIKLLWQHNPKEVIGLLTEVREDEHGLFVKGQLLMDVQRAREALELMQKGALDGLSIGFRTLKSRRDEMSGIRHLLELDLWEVSLVTFPMQEEARVQAFGASSIKTIRDYETFLRDAGGFSRARARDLAMDGYKALGKTREAVSPIDDQVTEDWGPVLKSLNTLIETLRIS